MASQSAVAVLRETPGDGRTEVELLLACGCRVTRTVPPDRILERDDGSRFVVGKYPCPLGHPVLAPP